ncbi:DMT family transporter [Levilactobacillus brevis]|uniref:DMT family transporter n=1 Tax=Levilactobacillus brevis TaxID=1580 RepID=UPI000A20152A|nr:DMT family transporter [Levilactobacillus brevis]ARN96698.1 hypothetical protein AZI10_00215 [Levilactobacillus brevis]
MLILALIPIAMGAGIASQSAINSRLKVYTRSPYVASTVSFLVGFIFLALLTWLSGQPLGISIVVVQQNPWWIWIGGVTAAFALTTNVLLFPILGSIQTSVLPIVGQIFMSLIIDQFGLFYSPLSRLTILKGLGVVVLILGMLLATAVLRVHDAFEQKTAATQRQLGWQILGVVAGALLAIQSAINGYLGTVLHSPIHGTMISFLIAFGLLLVVSLVSHQPIRQGLSTAVKAGKREWWIWLGGLLGSSYVLLSAWLVPILGTSQVIIIALCGQLVFSTLIDRFGWLRAVRHSVSRAQVIGLVLMLLGTILVKFG